MRNKIFFSVIVFAVGTFTVFTNYKTSGTKTDVALLMLEENVEALTNGEEGSGNYNICYSESKVAKGRTYYNCGDCPNKIYDEKGIGSYSKCFY